MAEMHVATSGPKARELVQVVLEEFDRWAKHAASQAAGIVGGDYEHGVAVGEAALYDVRTLLDDHLVIPIGLTLASWGIADE